MEPRDPRRQHGASSASEAPLTLPPINPRRIPAQVDEPEVLIQCVGSVSLQYSHTALTRRRISRPVSSRRRKKRLRSARNKSRIPRAVPRSTLDSPSHSAAQLASTSSARSFSQQQAEPEPPSAATPQPIRQPSLTPHPPPPRKRHHVAAVNVAVGHRQSKPWTLDLIVSPPPCMSHVGIVERALMPSIVFHSLTERRGDGSISASRPAGAKRGVCCDPMPNAILQVFDIYASQELDLRISAWVEYTRQKEEAQAGRARVQQKRQARELAAVDPREVALQQQRSQIYALNAIMTALEHDAFTQFTASQRGKVYQPESGSDSSFDDDSA